MFVNDCLNINEKDILQSAVATQLSLQRSTALRFMCLTKTQSEQPAVHMLSLSKSSTTATVCHFMPARRLAVRSFAELQTKSISDLM